MLGPRLRQGIVRRVWLVTQSTDAEHSCRASRIMRLRSGAFAILSLFRCDAAPLSRAAAVRLNLSPRPLMLALICAVAECAFASGQRVHEKSNSAEPLAVTE